MVTEFKPTTTIDLSIIGLPEHKEIKMVPGKISWNSEPSGGDLKHVLTIKIPMETAERAEVEQLVCKYWQFAVILSGNLKAEQGTLFSSVEGEGNQELPD